MNLFLVLDDIDDEKDLDKVLAKQNDLTVCPKWIARKSSAKDGIYKSYEDILGNNFSKNIVDKYEIMVEKFCLPNQIFNDFLIDGYSPLTTLKLPLWNNFIDVIIPALVIERLLLSISPEQILIVTRNKQRYLYLTRSYKNINNIKLRLINLSSKNDYSIFELMKKMKRIALIKAQSVFLDWHIKHMLSFSFGIFTLGQKPKHVKGIFIYDTYNQSMIGSLKRVQVEATKQGVQTIGLSADPRIGNYIKYENLMQLQFCSLFRMRYLLKYYKYYRSFLKSIKIHSEYFHSCLSTKYFDFYSNLSERALAHYLALTLVEAFSYEHALQRLTPQFLISGSDVHPRGNLFAQVARHLGIKTFVLQHGEPMSRSAYMPLISDEILVFGEDSKKQFQEWGVKDKQIRITGRVFSEDIPNIKIHHTFNGRILCGLTSITSVDFELLDSIFTAALELPDNIFVIRPHPGRQDLSLNLIIEKMPKNVILDNIHSVLDSILSCDIVICTNSSILFEAIMIGRPSIRFLSEFCIFEDPSSRKRFKYFVPIVSDTKTLISEIKVIYKLDQKKYQDKMYKKQIRLKNTHFGINDNKELSSVEFIVKTIFDSQLKML